MRAILFSTQEYEDFFPDVDAAEGAIRSAMPTGEVFAGDEALAFVWSPEAEAAAAGFPFSFDIIEYYD